MKARSVKVYTDGGARGNPGPAGIGAWITDQEGKEVAAVSRYIGETTNNQAEYRALIAGLEKAKDLGASQVACFMDSELVTKQMNRQYKVKDKDLAPLFVRVWNLAMSFDKVTYAHIRREKNTQADRLANEAMDRHAKS